MTNSTVTIETSLFNSLMKKLVNEAIEKSANAKSYVKGEALESKYGFDTVYSVSWEYVNNKVSVISVPQGIDADDVKDDIECYIYSLHADVNYHDVIHQASFDGFAMLKELWVSAGHSFINEQML